MKQVQNHAIINFRKNKVLGKMKYSIVYYLAHKEVIFI